MNVQRLLEEQMKKIDWKRLSSKEQISLIQILIKGCRAYISDNEITERSKE